jgi:hypothetical protein
MMPRPAKLTPPLLSAYQYINYMLYDSRKFEGDVQIPYGKSEEEWNFDDEVYGDQHFYPASSINPEHTAPLAAMSDATFGALIGSFGYEINGVDIKTRDDLVVAATTEDPDVNEDDWQPAIDGASLEQTQAYLLYHAKGEIYVDWRHVVDLYNESAPDQQEAIHQFFIRCLNRSLEDLLEMKGPEPLPANLVPVLESKMIDGKPCTYDDLRGRFVKDSNMILNFTVTGFERKNGGAQYPIATARTMEEAVAYATRFALDPNAKTIQSVSIGHEGNGFASAEVNGRYNSMIGEFKPELPIKLQWNTEKTGSPALKERLEKALFAAEKEFGVSWSKVSKLEDALGL